MYPLLNEKVLVFKGGATLRRRRKDGIRSRALLCPDRIKLRDHENNLWLTIPLSTVSSTGYLDFYPYALYIVLQDTVVILATEKFKYGFRAAAPAFQLVLILSILVVVLSATNITQYIPNGVFILLAFVIWIFGINRIMRNLPVTVYPTDWGDALKRLGVRVHEEALHRAQFEKLLAGSPALLRG